MSTAPQQQVQNTALEMFRKYKGTYSQNDMEKIVEEALQQERERLKRENEMLKLHYQPSVNANFVKDE